MIDKEKFKANLKETIDTIVFVVVAVILIRFFMSGSGMESRFPLMISGQDIPAL